MEQDAAEEMKFGVDAFEQTVRSTLQLGAALDDVEWRLPTECPGWSVQDNVSHLVDIERLLLGDPPPTHTLPADCSHVHNALGERNEIGVHARRQSAPLGILRELEDVLDRRLALLRDGSIDPHSETETPFGAAMSYGRFMAFRAFDCWVHEQDIRRATDRAGNLEAPAAQCARLIMRSSLPYVVGKASGAGPGQSVTFEVGDPLPFTERVEVDAGGWARTADVAVSTVTLSMDWQTFTRLGCGRCDPHHVPVTIAGDDELGQRVLANMSTTP